MKKTATLLSLCSLLLFSCSKDEEKGTPISSAAGSLASHEGANTAVSNDNQSAFLADFEAQLFATLEQTSLLPGNVVSGISENKIIDTTITFDDGPGSFDCQVNGKVIYDSDDEKAYMEEANLVYTFYNYKSSTSSKLYFGGQQGITLKVDNKDFGKDSYDLKGKITGAYRFNGSYCSGNGEYGVISYNADPITFQSISGNISRKDGDVTGEINSDLSYTLD